MSRSWFLLAILGCAAPADADPTDEILFSQNDWETARVQFDDGEVACAASSKNPDDSMMLWRFTKILRLQFFSESWNFGEGSVATVGLTIDENGRWDMTNAELFKNSILFDLPADDNAKRMIAELRNGETAVLDGFDATTVRSYSLLGAEGAIAQLDNCVPQNGNRPD